MLISRSAAVRGSVLAAAVALLAAAGAPSAGAATVTIGSPLTVPASLNTAENLNYEGSNVALPGSTFHISHDGADTALWNTAVPAGTPASPVAGEVTSIRLEGCAEQPQGAPAPLTQIHFHDLVPEEGGGARINLTSGAFDIPVCGAGGASGSTISTYKPMGLCINPGDYVGFNDEGGFVPSSSGPPPYPAGVPYKVIGAVTGATMDSFVRNGGTLNGTKMSPGDKTYHDGFAVNQSEELMLQATVGTGEDASTWCGGSSGRYNSQPSQPALPPLRVGKQTDGINHRGLAAIAMYCRLAAGCSGTLTLQLSAGQARKLKSNFTITGKTTSHFPVRIPAAVVKLARHHRGSGVSMKFSAVVAGKTIMQTIVLKIF